jgi:hypothetical protein
MGQWPMANGVTFFGGHVLVRVFDVSLYSSVSHLMLTPILLCTSLLYLILFIFLNFVPIVFLSIYFCTKKKDIATIKSLKRHYKLLVDIFVIESYLSPAHVFTFLFFFPLR